MKFFIVILIVGLVVLIGCIQKSAFERERPSDLYSCNKADNCDLTFRNIKNNVCCDSEVINKKYIEWYNKKALELVGCETTCPLTIRPEILCVNDKCQIK